MKSRRRIRRHTQVHLPPLDAGYALTLVDIFERAIAAIWRAHGDRMAEMGSSAPMPGTDGPTTSTTAIQTHPRSPTMSIRPSTSTAERRNQGRWHWNM